MHKYTYYSVNKASCCIITLMDHYYLLAYIGYYSNNVIIIYSGLMLMLSNLFKTNGSSIYICT